jgi:O-methyltransferase involved in polyketide biosynthesis
MAMELVDKLHCDFSRVQELQNEQIFYILRMREFDRKARAFLAKHPNGMIVDLGCGLDTRFERVDNGQVVWNGVDLQVVIELREELLGETARSHLVGCSLLDFRWMDALGDAMSRTGESGCAILFLAEAVLVYLDEIDVRRLVQALSGRFPGAELVCEVYSPVVLRAHPRLAAVAQPR